MSIIVIPGCLERGRRPVLALMLALLSVMAGSPAWAVEAPAAAAHGPSSHDGVDALSGRYRLLRSIQSVAPDSSSGDSMDSADDGTIEPVLEVRRDGSHWLLHQQGMAAHDTVRLEAWPAADYQDLFGSQRAQAKPFCAGSAMVTLCRVEPGTQLDGDEVLRVGTGFFLLSVDVGTVELERLQPTP